MPNRDAQYMSARVYACRFPPRLGELGSAKATSITDVSRSVRSGDINLLPNGEEGRSNTSRKSIVQISVAVLRLHIRRERQIPHGKVGLLLSRGGERG